MSGWVRVRGGYHYCQFCRAFFAATKKTPAWKLYAGVTSTSCACQACVSEEEEA